MKANPFLLAAAAALSTFAVPSFAQSDLQCIVAGRVSDGRWAPRFDGVTLLAASGQALTGSSREALAGVRQVRLARPALLTKCDGDQPLANGDKEAPGRKTPVPALGAGVVGVESVAFPKMRTTGGELVELRVRAEAQRVVMLTR
jgi:hypothetical protein